MIYSIVTAIDVDGMETVTEDFDSSNKSTRNSYM